MLPLFRLVGLRCSEEKEIGGNGSIHLVHSRKMQPTIRSGGVALGSACYYFRKVLELSDVSDNQELHR